MGWKIRKAAVLGAGVMGATIAAHLTNAGVECLLLDIVPRELSDEDRRKGLTESSREWRNRFAVNGLAQALKSKPASFFTKKNGDMVRTGNFEDDLDKLAEVDWVIEVVIENLAIKRELLARVAKVIKEDCILSTNTSGIPIRDIAAGFSPSLKGRFLGTHFFNPPRYMKLLEIIPGEKTRKDVVTFMKEFCERRLGKGVVICKDVPNFIGNRIGTFDISNAIRIMIQKGIRVDELDAIIGRALGRPGTAVFGTLDLVGLDTGAHVMKNLYEAVVEDEMRDYFLPVPFMSEMVEKKWLGNKTKQGFYQKVKDKKGKSTKMVLDYQTLTYVESTKPKIPSIGAAKKAADVAASVRTVFKAKDLAGEVTREYLCRNFIYAANRIPEIADSIYAIDNAMKWGYNHQLGPFETWDAIGVRNAVTVMQELSLPIPAKVEAMLAKGNESFYRKGPDGLSCYDFATGTYVRVPADERCISIKSLKEEKKVIATNPGATLVDLGEGVACLEFHTKMNAVDDDIIAMINESCRIVEQNFNGLVVGNEAPNFSAGANIFKVFMLIQKGDWDVLEQMIAAFQNANMRLKYLSKPVITAPSGLALGGGCEIAMHGDICLPHGETYMGLVEVGVGVIPAGGGCKELILRLTEGIPDGVVEAGLNLQQYFAKAFENIATAKVATSAREAMELGYIRKRDPVILNRDHQIWQAKQLILAMSGSYEPPPRPLMPVMGENFRGMADAILYNMRQGNYISDYDVHVSRKVAHILSGGDCPEGTWVTEQEILDLEREAFLSLCGEAKTQDRIMHMLRNGKPLRN
jgi:3-hydroxyacyl-CoA dehydrogenase